MRLDVFARPAGFPGGHALLAHLPAAGMGQSDTKRPALRTARHGLPAIQNPAGTSLLAARKHDFAGARDLFGREAEMQ